MARIEVHHLQDLAQRTTGKTHLGELMRRLVYATVAKRQPSLHFLAGETNGYAGWDGWVEVSCEMDGAVQRHRSVWELSTDRGFESKFRRDYKAASVKTLPSNWQKSEVIYVGLTLRSATPAALAKMRNELVKAHGNPWAGIVLLAADDIVQWLEKVPSVEDWAASEFQIGVSRFGKSLEHWYGAWTRQTTPPVSDRLLTSGRDISPLATAFRVGSNPVTTLQCDSVEEAIALVYCAAKSLSAADAQVVMASSLVVDDEQLADRLADQPLSAYALPTVILSPPATKHHNRLVQAGYRVIQALGRLEESTSVISFERASVREFAAALEETMGLPSTEAETQARAAGCSPSIWHIRNLFAQAVQPQLPEWAGVSQIDAVVGAVFAGAWREDSAPDIGVLVDLSGMDQSRLALALAPYATCTTPLLEVIGTSRMVIAPTAAFEFIRRHITRHHIDRLSRVCVAVFSDVSSVVDDRWRGGPPKVVVRDPRLEFSNGLRDGLAETLLRIAVLGAPLASNGALGGHTSAQSYVDKLVRSLPGLAQDPRVLASLDRQLPVLMEAAPDPFLDALDALIQGAPEELRLMLADEPGIFGRSFHTGLLWGLECLAWSPEYLPRVASELAGLARIDSGGQLSNRPITTLCEIFLPWHPGTSCDPVRRAEVLRSIAERYPDIGWRLLLELMPGKRRTSVMSHRPKWRNLGQLDRRSIGRSAVVEAYELNIELTLQVAGTDPKRLSELVDHYPGISANHKRQLEEAIRTAGQLATSPEELHQLSSRVHRLCRHHSSFADADWALPKADLERLQTIAQALTVEDPVLEHRWLFDEQFPDIGDRYSSHDDRARELQAKRKAALHEVLGKKGWSGIHELLSSVAYGYIVGTEVGLLDCADLDVLHAMDIWRTRSSPEWLAFRSASAARSSGKAIVWTDSLLNFARMHSWPPLPVAMAFVDYPDSRQTYDIVRGLSEDEQREYWTNRWAYVRGAKDDIDAFREAVESLLAHGRACDLIDQDWGDLPKLGYEVVLRVIDAFIAEPPSKSKAQLMSSIDHDLQHLFDWLRKQPEVSSESLARREYPLLPLLTNHRLEGSELALHKLLREQPEFFAEVVCHLYKPATTDRERTEGDVETVRMRAHAALELLESWHSPPGVLGDSIDGAKLAEWVDTARTLLGSRDRAEVGDQVIGKLLYYLPKDEVDDAYPPKALRALLERWSSEHLERGIEVEAFNSRGVTSRAIFEGGRQERDLAERWRNNAEKMGSQWPRSRGLCLRIAQMWTHHANAEDLDARRDRARQSR